MRRQAIVFAGLLLACAPSTLGYFVIPEQPGCTRAPGYDIDDKSASAHPGLSPRGASPAGSNEGAIPGGYRPYLLLILLLSLVVFAASVVVSQLAARAPRRIALRIPEDVTDRRDYITTWANEYASVADRGTFVSSMGLVYGVIAALLPASCAVLTLYFLSSCGAAVDNQELRTSVQYATLATLGAALTSLLLAFAEFWARLADRDLNDRAFDTALRSLLLASLCAIAAAVVIGNRGLAGSTWIDGFGDMMLIGIVAGVIGDYLFLATIEFVSLIFGRTSGLDEDIQSFIWIDGLDDLEGIRLREIGIRSAQALAFASPAYIFFRTRYPLARICDWQDQALLYVHLGQPMVQNLRSSCSFRGVLDLLSLLEQLHRSGTVMDSPADSLAQLRLRLREQPQIAALAVWRRCSTIENENAAPLAGAN